jgi:hypothetical protein
METFPLRPPASSRCTSNVNSGKGENKTAGDDHPFVNSDKLALIHCRIAMISLIDARPGQVIQTFSFKAREKGNKGLKARYINPA